MDSSALKQHKMRNTQVKYKYLKHLAYLVKSSIWMNVLSALILTFTSKINRPKLMCARGRQSWKQIVTSVKK